MRPSAFSALVSTLTLLLTLSAVAARAEPTKPGAPQQLGVLQPIPTRAAELRAAGVTFVVLSVSWDRFQPTAPGSSTAPLGAAYVATLRSDLDTYRQAGLGVILDPGFQYPPDWLFKIPDSRYVNQHGSTFTDDSPGMNVANSVFNRNIRIFQAAYLAALFRELGTDWTAVRLGGGWYGELNYPPATYNQQFNCYWAFDSIAQGTRPGLPAGIPPCPVPGWKPGKPTPSHTSARLFAHWYLDALKNYHDWQITTARRHYSGPLVMLYPSWGLRPGQLDAAIAANLANTTPPEKNGELQRGFDFARYIGGIRDPLVGVHCTWLDSNPDWSDDNSSSPDRWSPPKYLASLARRHVPPLAVSAENTGGGGMPALELSLRRIRELNIPSFSWAFAPALFDDQPPELKDLTSAP